LRALIPEGDPDLLELLVAQFEPGLAWLADQGIQLEPRAPNPYHRIRDRCYGMLPNAAAAMDTLARHYTEAGGRILTDAVATTLWYEPDGRLAGVRGLHQGGSLSAHGSAVILATGGFQGNSELLTRYMGRWADRLILRGNPYCTGDGYLMGLAAGAAASRGLHSFYGHHQPAPPAQVSRVNYNSVTPYFSEFAVIVNLRGERYTDESLGDEVSAQETAHQDQARCVILFDEHVYRHYAAAPIYAGAQAVDRLQAVRDAGGPVLQAESLDSLASGVAAWGVPAGALQRTLDNYNGALAANQLERLNIPRRANRLAVSNPPYYALLMVPGITLTHGGLKIDAAARVLDRRGKPLPGLFAAGADGGGIYYNHYAGGLALALVFGRVAGQSAAAA
jgi:succinate dehydrogenase/fumarate reductase flavoprotein subunit